MTVELIQGDCLEVLPTLAEKSVDMVFTDPPYGATDLEYEKNRLDKEVSEQLIRVVKDNGYLVSFGMFWNFALWGELWCFRYDMVWIKSCPNPRTHSAKKPMNQKENIAVFAHPKAKIKDLRWSKIYRPGKPYRKKQRQTGYRREGKDQLARSGCEGWTEEGYLSINNGRREITDVIYGPKKSTMKHGERTEHPTQKPLDVINLIIDILSVEGDTVLDPFMGSGTTGVAAQRMGRNFIGIEIDEKYFHMAKERIENDAPLFNGLR